MGKFFDRLNRLICEGNDIEEVNSGIIFVRIQHLYVYGMLRRSREFTE